MYKNDQVVLIFGTAVAFVGFIISFLAGVIFGIFYPPMIIFAAYKAREILSLFPRVFLIILMSFVVFGWYLGLLLL